MTDRESVRTYLTCPRKRWLTNNKVGDWSADAEYRLALADMLESETITSFTAATNADVALRSALLYAWQRIRLPRLFLDYAVIDAGHEESAALAPDVSFVSRSIVLKRKSDNQLFLYYPVTTSSADSRWQSSWEIDGLLQLECLAVEQRLGAISGIIVEGLITGKRVPVKNELGETTDYRQASPLIYGYKQDGYYECDYKKGWERFPVWEEDFGGDPIAYWVKWLPKNVAAAQFQQIIIPRRDCSSIVSQVVALERRIEDGIRDINLRTDSDKQAALDTHFPQNFSSCNYPKRCSIYHICHG